MIKKATAPLRKTLIYIVFGIGSLFIGIIVLPIERLLFHPLKRYKRVVRKTIHIAHRIVFAFGRLLGILEIVGGKPDLSNLEGKIIAPNHPSLLDVVLLFSMIPDANCIVRGGLLKTPVGFIVKALYIPNNEDFEELKENCKKSLDDGDALIIFPEGTRTAKGKDITLKRGAAVISLYSGAPIVPFFMTGNDKEGLRKHDKFYSINGDGYYTFSVERSNVELKPGDYVSLGARNASVRMTEDLERILRKGVGK